MAVGWDHFFMNPHHVEVKAEPLGQWPRGSVIPSQETGDWRPIRHAPV